VVVAAAAAAEAVAVAVEEEAVPLVAGAVEAVAEELGAVAEAALLEVAREGAAEPRPSSRVPSTQPLEAQAWRVA
jgi:hypothetical protein